MTIEPPTPTLEEGPKVIFCGDARYAILRHDLFQMRRVKRVIKKKDPEAKKEEMRKEGEEFLRSKVAMVDEGKGAKVDETNNNREQADKVGFSVAEKSNEKVANVTTSASDEAQDDALSLEEEAVLAKEMLTEKEKLVMSAVLSNRRSRSRSNSRMGERIQENPRSSLESPVPPASRNSSNSSPLPSPESPAASPLPLVAEEQPDLSSSQEKEVFTPSSSVQINSKVGQNKTKSGGPATEIISASNVVRKDKTQRPDVASKNPDPQDNRSARHQTKNGHDVEEKYIIRREKRPEEDLVIATEKSKEVEKKKSPQQPTNIPVQGKLLEENNNNISHRVEVGNENNVVVRPNRQKVASDKADTKVLNGTRKLMEEPTTLRKEDKAKIPKGANKVKEETVKLEDNTIVEEIRDSVKDVRDILDRLSKNEEAEQVKENIEEKSALTTDNQAEKSVECPVVLKTSQKKEQNMENSAEVSSPCYISERVQFRP